MADPTADEDAPLTSLRDRSNNEDNDQSDELQDFRFLAALTGGPDDKRAIPKRGEKDFEPHGTKYQDAMLAASREAMHNALDYTRVHTPKSNCRAWYFGDGVLANETDTAVLSEAVRGRGLNMDHVVMVESSKGSQYRTMGKTALGTLEARLWLLPEEALYLVERGSLDLWWPSRPMSAVRGEVRLQGTEIIGEGEEEEDDDDGLPLSLEAAYALLIGEDGEEGKVSLDKYVVYANLKRTGYVVSRHRGQDSSLSNQTLQPYGRRHTSISTLFSFLFGAFFAGEQPPHAPYGPLVRPGLYRSYNHIYKQLSVVPSHVPSPQLPENPKPSQYPFCLAFKVWKPSRIPNFAKSNPGEPDFRIAVVSSRSSNLPSLPQLVSLLESSPWDPPPKEWTGPEKTYQRLKHGSRNVVLAVVDQGIISYLRISESAFGEEKLFERFDRGGIRGGKRGGGHGRGPGRGRGRGR